MQELVSNPVYSSTIGSLEAVKRTTADGTEYWKARDIHGLLGYPAWDKFLPVIERAKASLEVNGISPSHHIAHASKMMGVGRGATREGVDYYLTRAACYLIAMNGDPAKPEIAAAQAYFTVQTRRVELQDETSAVPERSGDEKRIELREKVRKSAKAVSGAAAEAGVTSKKQPLFHNARYQGLYGMNLRQVKSVKGLGEKDDLLDRAGLLELSAHDFQMNLAANVIKKDNIQGEQRAIDTNLAVAKQVRKAMEESGATMLEKLQLEAPIKEVQKRLRNQKKLAAKA